MPLQGLSLASLGRLAYAAGRAAPFPVDARRTCVGQNSARPAKYADDDLSWWREACQYLRPTAEDNEILEDEEEKR